MVRQLQKDKNVKKQKVRFSAAYDTLLMYLRVTVEFWRVLFMPVKISIVPSRRSRIAVRVTPAEWQQYLSY